MKLSLTKQRGRKQEWLLDGVKVSSVAGDGHAETKGPDERANKIVGLVLRGSLCPTLYPKLGDTIELPDAEVQTVLAEEAQQA